MAYTDLVGKGMARAARDGDLTMTNFNALPMNGPTGLRSIANKEYGISNVRQYSKAALVEMLTKVEAEREEARNASQKQAMKRLEIQTEEAAKPAKKGKAAKAPKTQKSAKARCSVCEKRPAGGKDVPRGCDDMCALCYEEAGWENTPNDEGHEQGEGDNTGCWICHPELNKASESYVARQGTSRLGMTMSVSVRAAGEVKANQAVGHLKGEKEFKTNISVNKRGATRLVIEGGRTTITLIWTETGAYDYANSSLVEQGNRPTKVRNV